MPRPVGRPKKKPVNTVPLKQAEAIAKWLFDHYSKLDGQDAARLFVPAESVRNPEDTDDWTARLVYVVYCPMKKTHTVNVQFKLTDRELPDKESLKYVSYV